MHQTNEFTSDLSRRLRTILCTYILSHSKIEYIGGNCSQLKTEWRKQEENSPIKLFLGNHKFKDSQNVSIFITNVN